MPNGGHRLFIWKLEPQICGKRIETNKSEPKFHSGFDTVYADFVVTSVLGNEWESIQIIMLTKMRVQAVGRWINEILCAWKYVTHCIQQGGRGLVAGWGDSLAGQAVWADTF